MKPEHIRALRDEKPTPDGSNHAAKGAAGFVQMGRRMRKRLRTIRRCRSAAMVATRLRRPSHLDARRGQAVRGAPSPSAAKARLAMALMLYTTGRREDATRFGPQHVRTAHCAGQEVPQTHRLHAGEERASQAGAFGYPDSTRSSSASSRLPPSGPPDVPQLTQLGKPFTPGGLRQLVWRSLQGSGGASPGRAHGLRKAGTATQNSPRPALLRT